MAVVNGRVDIQIRTEGVGNAAPKVKAVAKEVDGVQKAASAAAAPVEGLSRKVQSMKAGLDPLEKLKSGFDSIVGSLGFVGMAASATVGLVVALADAFDDTEKKAAAAKMRLDLLENSYRSLADSADRFGRSLKASIPGAEFTSEGSLLRLQAEQARLAGGAAPELKALELERLAEEADRRGKLLSLQKQRVELMDEENRIVLAITAAEQAGEAALAKVRSQYDEINRLRAERNEGDDEAVKAAEEVQQAARKEADSHAESIRILKEKLALLKASKAPFDQYIAGLKTLTEQMEGRVSPAEEKEAARIVEARKKKPPGGGGRGGGDSAADRAARLEMEMREADEKAERDFQEWRRRENRDRFKRLEAELEVTRREEAANLIEARRREIMRERMLLDQLEEAELAERGIRANAIGAGGIAARDARAEGIAQFTRQLGESLPQMGAFTSALGSMASAWSDVTAANENAIRIEGEYREGRATETQLLEAMADARKAEGQAAINSVGFLAKAGAESIKNERMRAGVLAVIETGLGLGKAALGDYVGAAGHFAAAATLGSVAIFGGKSSGSGDKQAERARQQLSQSQQSQQQQITQVNVWGGWFGSSSPQENAWALEQQARRHVGNGFARAA